METRWVLQDKLVEHVERVTGIDWAPISNRIVTCGSVRYILITWQNHSRAIDSDTFISRKAHSHSKHHRKTRLILVLRRPIPSCYRCISRRYTYYCTCSVYTCIKDTICVYRKTNISNSKWSFINLGKSWGWINTPQKSWSKIFHRITFFCQLSRLCISWNIFEILLCHDVHSLIGCKHGSPHR